MSCDINLKGTPTSFIFKGDLKFILFIHALWQFKIINSIPFRSKLNTVPKFQEYLESWWLQPFVNLVSSFLNWMNYKQCTLAFSTPEKNCSCMGVGLVKHCHECVPINLLTKKLRESNYVFWKQLQEYILMHLTFD